MGVQVQINLRVDEVELGVLDGLRGGLPRNTFLRRLIREEGERAAARGASAAPAVLPGQLEVGDVLDAPPARRRVVGVLSDRGNLPPAAGYARVGS